MNQTRSIYRLVVSSKGDGIKGTLSGHDHEIADFYFPLKKANSRARELLKATAYWVEAFERGHKTEGARWQALHDEAARCYAFIFNQAATTVEECLAEASADTEIWVQHNDSDLRMPWGLLCTPSDAARASAKPLQPMLWSAKYNVRTQLDQGRSSQRRREPWRFEAVVCKKTYAEDLSTLPIASIPLARTIHSISRDPRETRRPSDTVPNCFIYVHAHSIKEEDQWELLFRPEDSDSFRREPIEIIRSVVPMGNGVAVLAILNACQSTSGFSEMGCMLVQQSSNLEVACIATEVDANRPFATEFGLELIDLCVQKGESTYAAMKALRMKHYPLSIIYSHYCKADLITDKPLDVFDPLDLDAYRASIENINYSYRQRAGAAP
jgi:hypothetical protein